jgi:putative flippase GtrA
MNLQVWRYVVLTAVNYLLQVLVVYLVHDLAGQNFYLGVFLGIALTLVVGFLGNQRWVFGAAAADVRLAGHDNNHVRPQKC